MTRAALLIAIATITTATLLGCPKKESPPSSAADAAPEAGASAAAAAADTREAKRAMAEEILKKGNVDVYFDPRKPGVQAPPSLLRQPRLILKFGRLMPTPIPDLKITNEEISGTLSFSQIPFFCKVPLATVFAMIGDDDQGTVWNEDIPQELRDAGMFGPTDASAATPTTPRAQSDASPN